MQKAIDTALTSGELIDFFTRWPAVESVEQVSVNIDQAGAVVELVDHFNVAAAPGKVLVSADEHQITPAPESAPIATKQAPQHEGSHD